MYSLTPIFDGLSSSRCFAQNISAIDFGKDKRWLEVLTQRSRAHRSVTAIPLAFGHLPLFLVELEGKEQCPIAVVSTATAPKELEHHPLLGAAIVANHDTSVASQDATKTTRAPGTDTGECRRPSTLVVVVVVVVVVEQQ